MSLIMIRHKFNAVHTESDGYKFASKKEAKRYQELKLLQQCGDVVFFLIQVPFRLPGGVKYIVDFEIFWANGEVTFEDVKGFETDTFKMKRKMVEELYAPVKIITS